MEIVRRSGDIVECLTAVFLADSALGIDGKIKTLQRGGYIDALSSNVVLKTLRNIHIVLAINDHADMFQLTI